MRRPESNGSGVQCECTDNQRILWRDKESHLIPPVIGLSGSPWMLLVLNDLTQAHGAG